MFALLAVFATQATIVYADKIDGTTADKAFLHLGSARDVDEAGRYYFNIDGVTFSTWVNADGDLVVYSDVIPGEEGDMKVETDYSIAEGRAGPTPRVTDLVYGKKGYLDGSIMGIMGEADRLRIPSLPKNRLNYPAISSRLDATTTHPTLIDRVLTNKMLMAGNKLGSVNEPGNQGANWTNIQPGSKAYLTGSTGSRFSSLSELPDLTHNVYHTHSDANALHWRPETQSGFAIDYNGSNNQAGHYSWGDERLGKGSILQLLLRFPRPEPKLQVTKTSDFATKTANLGDVITYTYEIKNAGFTYIENISISDDHRAEGSFEESITDRTEEGNVTTDKHLKGDSVNTDKTNGVWDQLGPGDVLTVTTTYKVTEADIIAYGTE